MRKNIGSVDKIIRLLIAVVIVILFATNIISGTLGIILLVVAGVLVITGLVNFCGLYAILGINTCKTKKA